VSAATRLRTHAGSHARRAAALLARIALLALAALSVAVLAACGSSGSALEVSAAASLREAFTRYGHELPGAQPRYSFAGSDALAAQIEQGVRPDVFASANVQLPQELYAKGLVERPVVFAANRLVVAVPVNSRITSLAALTHPGLAISLGTRAVPIGAYTEKVLARIPPARRRAILANVRDREPDVTGIVGKLTQGAVDAGLLYVTDVRATAGRLRAIELPAVLQPQVAYAAAVVKGSGHRAQARAFIAGLLDGAGRTELLRAGFLPTP
jgi:molybdate transport system substrate-binding protein